MYGPAPLPSCGRYVDGEAHPDHGEVNARDEASKELVMSPVADYVPVFTILSSIVSAVSLTIAFIAFRRTSRFQDVDYRAHLTFSAIKVHGAVDVDREVDDDEEEETQRGLEVVCQGTITNVGPKPVTLTRGRVQLGPRHRDDPEDVLTVPLHTTLGTGVAQHFEFAMAWGTIWTVAKQFNRTNIDCRLVVSARGADGVATEITKFVAEVMQTEGEEWCAVPPDYFVELTQGIQQARLRHRLDPRPTPAERAKLKAASSPDHDLPS